MSGREKAVWTVCDKTNFIKYTMKILLLVYLCVYVAWAQDLEFDNEDDDDLVSMCLKRKRFYITHFFD